MGQLIFWTLLTVIAVLVAKWFINHDGHPKALFYLFFAEMWERFSFLWNESSFSSIYHKRLHEKCRKQ